MSHPRRLAISGAIARNYGIEVDLTPKRKASSKHQFLPSLGGGKDTMDMLSMQHALPGSSPAPNSNGSASPGPNGGVCVSSPGPNVNMNMNMNGVNSPSSSTNPSRSESPIPGGHRHTHSFSPSPGSQSSSGGPTQQQQQQQGSASPRPNPASPSASAFSSASVSSCSNSRPGSPSPYNQINPCNAMPSPPKTTGGLRINVPSPAPVASPPNYHTLPAIERSHRWVITGTLQQSLFGVVKLAFDRELKAQVAIKISRRELSNKQHTRSGVSVLENVKREASIMRYLKARAGPLPKELPLNIKEDDDTTMTGALQPAESELLMGDTNAEAPVFVEGEMDGSRYVAQFVEELEDEYFHYVMTEFVPAGDMYSMLTSYPNHRLSEDQARFFFKQIVLAIKHLHDRNVAHLDLSLENICLDVDDSIRIIDFGVAAIHPLTPIEYTSQYLIYPSSSTSLCGIKGNPSNGPSFLCKPVQELSNKPGKLRYMSPELLSNQPWDAFKNDIFALGVILYSLLTGRPPFQQADSGDVWFSVIYSGSWLTPAIMNQPAAHVYGHLSNEARNLIDIIIKPQDKRPSCEVILNHPWLAKA